jgi:hypothetical protein
MTSFSAVGIILLILGVLAGGAGISYGLSHSTPVYAVLTETQPAGTVTNTLPASTVFETTTASTTIIEKTTSISMSTVTSSTTKTKVLTTTSVNCPDVGQYNIWFSGEDTNQNTMTICVQGSTNTTVYLYFDESTTSAYTNAYVTFGTDSGALNWGLGEYTDCCNTIPVQSGSAMYGTTTVAPYWGNYNSNEWLLNLQCSGSANCAVTLTWYYS